MDLTRRRRSVERILEDESLTAHLTDQAAEILLNWAVAQAEAMMLYTEGSPQAELHAQLEALRRTIKHTSRQAGRSAPEAQADEMRALLAEIDPEQDMRVQHGP